jgi:hypothetical protein
LVVPQQRESALPTHNEDWKKRAVPMRERKEVQEVLP